MASRALVADSRSRNSVLPNCLTRLAMAARSGISALLSFSPHGPDNFSSSLFWLGGSCGEQLHSRRRRGINRRNKNREKVIIRHPRLEGGQKRGHATSVRLKD